MGEPGGVIETESPGRLGCHHSNMKQDDEALALLASLPFIFFHLSNPSAYWGDAGKQNRAYILVGGGLTIKNGEHGSLENRVC